MRKGFSLLMVIAALFSTIFGCGGGGSSSSPTPTPTPGNTVSGVASKGLINAGLVTVYAITNNVKGATLATGTTGANGAYTLDIGSYTGPVLVEVSGGTYLDEATNSTKTGPTLHAVVNATTATTVAVTPLTELAWQNVGSTINAATINQANVAVGGQFGNINIINTLPVDFKSPPSGATQEQKNYAAYLAMISQIVKLSGRTLDTTSASIYQNELKLTSGSLSATAVLALNTALQTVAPGTVAIGTPTTPPNLVLSASKSVAAADGNDAITFTASFRKSDGSAYGIADGTVVTFTMTNGTYTATSVSPAKSDQATAVMKSSTPGNFIVTASYTTDVTATTTVQFVNTSIQASKTSIFSDGSDKATLTASFTPALPDGTPVTFTIASGTAQFANGQKTATATTSSNAATVDIVSSTVGSVTVSAAYGTVSPAAIVLSFIAPTTTADVTITLKKAIGQLTILQFKLVNTPGATQTTTNNENQAGFSPFIFGLVTTNTLNVAGGYPNPGASIPANTVICKFTYSLSTGGAVPGFSIAADGIVAKTYNNSDPFNSIPVDPALTPDDFNVIVTYK